MKTRIMLNKYGRKEVIGHIVGPLIIGLIFFSCAGRMDLSMVL